MAGGQVTTICQANSIVVESPEAFFQEEVMRTMRRNRLIAAFVAFVAFMATPALAAVPYVPPIYTFNAVIATTGTAVQLTTTAQNLNNGLLCFAVSTGKIGIGFSSSVTNGNTAFSGAFVGTPIANGQGWSAAIGSPTAIWINGNAGDGVSCWGN